MVTLTSSLAVTTKVQIHEMVFSKSMGSTQIMPILRLIDPVARLSLVVTFPISLTTTE